MHWLLFARLFSTAAQYAHFNCLVQPRRLRGLHKESRHELVCLQVTVKSKTAKAAAKSDEEGILALCKGFRSCEATGVLLSQVCACCSRCSNQIMWRVELCAGCRGCSTGYAFYHVQAADKAVRDGALRLFFGYFAEEVEHALDYAPLHCLTPGNVLLALSGSQGVI